MELIQVIGIVLMALGFVLAIVEMLIPGFGLPGITGGVCMIAGVIMKAQSVEEGLTLATILLVALAAALTVIVVFFKSKKVKSPIGLDSEVSAKDSFLGTEDMNYLVGKSGITTTDLRPAGKMEIDGVEFDVRSENYFIDKGTKVEVIRIQNGSVIVKQ